ncbi:MAG: hypothetical protein JWP75_3137 [Frondihabitans sp.]|nr:hypothetical protein [Frondihabitans sp.]
MRLLGAVALCALASLLLAGCAPGVESPRPIVVGVVTIDLDVDSLVLTTLEGGSNGVPLSDGAAVLASLTRELGTPRVAPPDPRCTSSRPSYEFGHGLRVTGRGSRDAQVTGPVTVNLEARSVESRDGHRVDLHGPGGLQVGDPAASSRPTLLERSQGRSTSGVVAGTDGRTVAWIGSPVTLDALPGC